MENDRDKSSILKVIQASFALFAVAGLALWFVLEENDYMRDLYLEGVKVGYWFEYWVLLVAPGIVIYGAMVYTFLTLIF